MVRTRRGMTQEEVANAMNNSGTFLSDIERGRRNLTWSTLMALAGALEVKPSELAALAEILADPPTQDRPRQDSNLRASD
jgi:transcriptional regulator with XRE-family HTH domain